MKKLLLILLCLPLLFGCGSEESKGKIMSNVPTTSLRQGCNYEGSVNDATELCEFYKGNNFATDRSADIALDKILLVTGLSKTLF